MWGLVFPLQDIEALVSLMHDMCWPRLTGSSQFTNISLSLGPVFVILLQEFYSKLFHVDINLDFHQYPNDACVNWPVYLWVEKVSTLPRIHQTSVNFCQWGVQQGRVEVGGRVAQLSQADHITCDFVRCPHLLLNLSDMLGFSQISCIFQVWDILQVGVIWGIMKTVSGVLHVLAMRELPEAQVEHIYSSSLRVFGFYQPVSGWPLPATVTGLLSSLIHLLSSPQSSGYPPGWPRTEFPSLQLRCTFEALGRPELEPDAERAGYEST